MAGDLGGTVRPAKRSENKKRARHQQTRSPRKFRAVDIPPDVDAMVTYYEDAAERHWTTFFLITGTVVLIAILILIGEVTVV